MEKKASASVYLFILITFFCWGSVYVVSKYALGALPAPAVCTSRVIVGVLAVLFLARKEARPNFTKEEKRSLLMIAFFGYFSTQQLVTLGISLTGASMAALINSLTPVAITIVAAIVLKEKIDAVKIICLALAIAGPAVVTLDSGVSGGNVLGVAAVLVSLATWAIASTHVRRLTQKYSAIIVTLYGMALSLVFQVPVAVGSIIANPGSVNLSLTTVAALLYLGIVGTGVGQVGWSRCLQLKEASFCSMFYPLQPVFSALLGALLLGETFRPMFFVGLVLIAADVILICLHNSRLEKKAAAEKEGAAA